MRNCLKPLMKKKAEISQAEPANLKVLQLINLSQAKFDSFDMHSNVKPISLFFTL